MTHKIAVFMGTRPEAIKMAPVVAALQASDDFTPLVINSGQHRELIDQVITLFKIKVDHNLQIMQPNQTLAGMTARLITKIDAVLQQEKPALSLVQGDTTTVMTAALTSFYHQIPVGHIEAGLRTGDMTAPFPEEGNRRLTSPLAHLHFPPTPLSRKNLLAEGIPDSQIVVTGNTVIDALQIEVARQADPTIQADLNTKIETELGVSLAEKPYILVTGHRRENFGGGFENICKAIATLANKFADYRFIYPVHLNPNVQEIVHRQLGTLKNVHLISPQPYSEFIHLLSKCHLVLTDSGGVQEEAPSLGKPVLVMRTTTERPEGITAGTVQLVGTDQELIISSVSKLIEDEDAYRKVSDAVNPYGDGQAAGRILESLRLFFNK